MHKVRIKSYSFRFKKFEIAQDRCAMKVGTDGVLLGAWCNIPSDARKALDIGTGTGVIALMLAQRGEKQKLYVDAVDTDANAAAQAAENAVASKWRDRLKVFSCPVQQLHLKNVDPCGTDSGGQPTVLYDIIVSNPPYFSASLLPPDSRRGVARHTVDLDFDGLAIATDRLLAPRGVAACIVPNERSHELIAVFISQGFVLNRRTDVCTVQGTNPKRSLLEFVRPGHNTQPVPLYDSIAISDPAMGFTPEYIALTKDFYLRF